MDIEKYIASGVLELYVAGALSAEENREVRRYAQKHPEIKAEIEAIEKAVLAVAKKASPGLSPGSFSKVKNRLTDVMPLPPEKSEEKTPWSSYLGWAAALLFAVGLLWIYLENNELKSKIEVVNEEKQSLEEQILKARSEMTYTEQLLNELRDQNVAVVALGGQAVSPESYAKAYWNKEEQKVYIDAQGLPEPPPGYTYQVWSLKLNPLTPASIGLLDDFVDNDTKIFELPNPNESEAFGITLEPEGGSDTPTLEQLYALGAVAS